jgi:transcriptional regulator with GAF, ATPase, and Fis domain
VRELRNTVLAAATTARARGAAAIDLEDVDALTVRPTAAGVTRELPSQSGPPSRHDDNYARRSPAEEQVLRDRIVAALERAEGNVAQVARDLDMRRAGLYEAFGRLGIDPTQYRRR